MVMAAMVESARPRVSQRGNRFLNLTLSDRSGQFQSSCFDEIASKTLEALAADGGCAMLSVELDLLEGEERSEAHTSELQSLMRTPYAVFCLKKNITSYTCTVNITTIQ